MYATLHNDTKKTNFTVNETLNIYKDEQNFPLAYDVKICSIKLDNRFYLIKDGIAYLIDEYFATEYRVLSERRQLFERDIDNLIITAIRESK